MSKYIDVEKLIAEIERYKNKADERLKIKGRTFSEEQKDLALQNLCGNLLHFISSLQQEHDSISEQFAKIVRRNLTEISENAQKQFEQLYFKITNEKMYGGYKD